MTAVLTLPTTTNRSALRTISLDDLTIDRTVQRDEGIDQRRIDKMAPNFNPEALGLFIASERPDGTLVCLDGMHRRALALQIGWAGNVDARVFTGLTHAEEAALFILYNDKRNISAITKFLARVVAEDEVAVDINNIVRTYGWQVRGLSNAQGYINAASALESAYRNGFRTVPTGAHPELLARVMSTATDAWGHDPAAMHESMIGGLAQLFGRFGDAVDRPKLVQELQGTQPRPLVGKAKALKDIQGGTVPAALAKILVPMHNGRRRTNLLPEWVWTR